MVIIENQNEVEKILESVVEQDILVIPILADTKSHPAANSISVLALSTRASSYLIPFNHNDCLRVDSIILNRLAVCRRIWTPNKTTLLHLVPNLENIFDVNSLEYLSTGNVTVESNFYTLTHKKLHELYEGRQNVNSCVPIMKHMEFLESYIAHAWAVVCQNDTLVDDSGYRFLNDYAIPSLQFIEHFGIHINPTLAEEKFGSKIKRHIKNDLVYSEYNLFTTTGRCSNKFGGINFAALNKKDGTREIFTSRFENGMMVMADFESFHLRLIGEMIGYKFPSDLPVHEYLGRQYFNKEILTPEEYDEGKQITFQLLYGEHRNFEVPEFFTEVYKYIDMLMVLLDKQGYIKTPYFQKKIYKDRIEEPTPAKVFNYMIQMAETERNLVVVNKLREWFKEKKSCPVIYTYDSILFDYNVDDGTDLLRDVIRVLSNNGRYPMRVYYGTDYHNLKRLNL